MIVIVINLLVISAHVSVSKFDSPTNLVSPWKWRNDFNDDWSFEKHHHAVDESGIVWLEKEGKKILANYTQVSAQFDSDGSLSVVLKKVINTASTADLSIKLVEGYCCQSDETYSDCIQNPITTGYWAKKHESCDSLPRQCKYIKYRRLNNRALFVTKGEGILCENVFDDERMLEAFANTWDACPRLQASSLMIAMKPSSNRYVIDASFGIFQLGRYLPKLRNEVTLRFLHFKGFDIDSQIRLSSAITNIELDIDFNLYKQNRLIKECGEFANANASSSSSSRGFIFQKQKKNDLLILTMKNPKITRPVCASFFRNARINGLLISYLANSLLIKNSLSFADDNESTNDNHLLNSTIDVLTVRDSYGIDIDAKLLNVRMFSKTTAFGFTYQVNRIESSAFRPFVHLREIYLDPFNFIQLVRRQGIEWIRQINSHVNVDFTRPLDLLANVNHIKGLCLDFNRDFVMASASRRHFAFDHDFCLFADYPFKQLVFIYESRQVIFNRATGKNPRPRSSTESWLLQYLPHLLALNLPMYEVLNGMLKQPLSQNSSFEKRIDLCNKSNFNRPSSLNNSAPFRSTFSTFDLMLVLEPVLIFLSACFAAYGLVNNLITIYVIHHMDSNKTTTTTTTTTRTQQPTEKHYVYMSLHCVCNTLVCFIQIVSMASECGYPFGFFCSSIRASPGVQYVKIVLGEYISSVCRLLGNFTYLGFSLCRMSKIGYKHAKVIVFVNDLSVAKYMFVSVIVSASLSVCKALQFDINFDFPEYAYPMPFVQNVSRFWFLQKGYVVITVINAVYDAITYFGFILVHLGVDLVLVKKLRQVLSEKEEKLKEMNMGGGLATKIAEENNESRRRLVVMVVFSSVFGLVTKMPSMLTSMNDVRLIIRQPMSVVSWRWFAFDPRVGQFSFSYFCLSQKSCILIQHFGNCLFSLSMCSTHHFLKRFDKNFRAACEQVFPSKIRKSN